tara:strand:- start:150005 stop:150904 length:900 start_codon:yes stop_codon:yes gene_type:complete
MKNIYLILLTLITLSCAHTPKPYNGVGNTKIALSRFFIQGGKTFPEHMQKVESDIRAASKKGAKYILLAELNTLDVFTKEPKDVDKEINDLALVSNSYEKELSELAKKYQINIIGATSYTKIKNKLLNRAYFINAKGMINYQDKVYPTPWEKKHKIANAKNQVKLFKTKDFSFVILICHDSEFPQLSVQLKKLKPELIFVPSQTDGAYGRERVRATSRARAIENMSYVFLNGGHGSDKEPWHSYVGGASFFWPQNKYFKLGGVSHFPGAGEPQVIAIDLKKLRKARGDKTQVYPQRDAL